MAFPTPGQSTVSLNLVRDNMTTVSLLLATYNGMQFLPQQIQSICEQTDTQILIRDDGSEDDTPALLRRLVGKYPNIQIIEDNYGRLGVRGNFSLLLEHAYNSGASHIMLADQDDVWMAEKFSLQTRLMQQLEKKFPDTPLLIHSDLEVVNATLQKISPSLMCYQGIEHKSSNPVDVLLAQNFVTGCTAMGNRKLLEIALPLPNEAVMHDWWLALCAATFGKIGYVSKPLVQYRQHGGNVVGAKHLVGLLQSGLWKKQWLSGRENLFRSMQQARELAKRVREYEPQNLNLPLIESYASLANDSPLQRIKKILALGVRMQSRSRQALMLSRLLLTPKDWHV